MAASGPNGTHDKFMARGPGITTGRSGVLGRVFYVESNFWPLNTSLWVREFRRASPSFAFYLLRHLDLARYNAGSAVPTLNRNHVHNLPMMVPSEQAISNFDSVASPLLELVEIYRRQRSALSALLDALLPELVSGRIRVTGVGATAAVAS
jgi:type I restriction enzyme, S subunit